MFWERDPVGYGDSGDLYQILIYDFANRRDPSGAKTWAVYLDKEKVLSLVNVQDRFLGMVPSDLPRAYPSGYPEVRQKRVIVRYSVDSGEIIGAGFEEVELVRDWNLRKENPPWKSQEKVTNILEWEPSLSFMDAYARMDDGGRMINELISGWLLSHSRERKAFRNKGPVADPRDFVYGIFGLVSNAISLVALGTEVSPLVVWAGRALGLGSKAARYLGSKDMLSQVESSGVPCNLGIQPRRMREIRKKSQWNKCLADHTLMSCH